MVASLVVFSHWNGRRTILRTDINHPIVDWHVQSSGIWNQQASWKFQHIMRTFFASRLQEREVWKNMENGWCCWWTKNIQSPVCFRQFLTKHVLKLSQDCDVGSSLALRSTVHYHWSKQRRQDDLIRMQGFLYINSIQLATLSSKKSSNNLIPPERSRLQGQEKSAKILVQVWASSNLSVTSHAQIWLHHGNHRRQEVYKAVRRTGLMTIPTSR